MITSKLKPITKGIIKSIPGMELLLHKRPGSTSKSRYCYTVWFRHLVHANKSGLKGVPETVAELGPGGSIGVGLAAILSGCKQYFALDIVNNWETERNLRVFDELVLMFKNRERIPDNDEFPKINSELDNYDFPKDIITDKMLEESLDEKRLKEIREEIINFSNGKEGKYFKYQVPWNDAKVIQSESVDLIYSQAVLEHVNDLDGTYKAMYEWLKPGAIMSHEIDFKCHNTSPKWNGHWTYSNLEWKLVKGRYQYLINRQPFTSQIKFHDKYGFTILKKILNPRETEIRRKELAKEFKNLTDEELTTSAMFIQSRKPSKK